jgi:hypothetical protein
VFFSSQNIDFPFYLMRLLELFFLFPFSSFFLFSMLRLLRTWGFDDIGGENDFFKNPFSNGMTWNGMVMTVDILVVDAYSRMELCTPI